MSKINTEDRVSAKRARVPVHEAKDKFRFRGLDNDKYQYRLVRMDEDRLFTFLEAGYAFVRKGGQVVPDSESTSVVSTSEGIDSLLTVPGGLGVTQVLMAIPKEIWLADQAKKEDAIAAQEAEMKLKLQSQIAARGGVVEIGR